MLFWLRSFTGGVGVAGLLLNVWTQQQERRQRSKERAEDRKEWYGKVLFERRVDATQEAYKWIIRLHRYGRVHLTNSDEESSAKLRETCLEAREWYDSKAVFLYDDLPRASEFIGLINAASEVRQGRGASEHLSEQVEAASKATRDRLDSLMKDVRGADDAR
ncbi:MAG: hypothetical protein IIC86_10370 [Chloroflexi bacterium]|nr:hypothetical protein [Chloroflexota bacterium]